MWRRTLLWLAVLLASLCVAAQAGDRDPVKGAGVWMAVSNQRLETQRGGFDAGSGLMVSFGITRATYINGALVTQTSLNLGQVTALTPAQAAMLSRQMAQLNLIQIGPGNSISPDSAAVGVGTVIQNTLDNQHIVNQTVVNASSNAMGMIKSMNLQSTLADSLAGAVGNR